ncbi:MAG TPA: hypothetical protein VGS22_05990 [Thermoanaerobaculia bacterium]|jgi:hypothetical protein|nr:hypothetical protein [Thermoanaerobaculia bacterium]
MLSRILPDRIDNTYLGHPLAVWLLAAVVFMKSGIALGTLFNGRVAAQSADGIPLNTFGADGAQAVVALFAIWGLAQLVINLFGILALTRYRAMIPFMFLLLLVEHLARKSVLWWKPIARTGTPPGPYINLALVALMVVGLALSLRKRTNVPLQP